MCVCVREREREGGREGARAFEREREMEHIRTLWSSTKRGAEQVEDEKAVPQPKKQQRAELIFVA